MNPDREIIFRQRKSGLYFHSMSNREVVLVNIVKNTRKGFYQHQCESSKQARLALAMVGYPYEKDFKNMVNYRMTPN